MRLDTALRLREGDLVRWIDPDVDGSRYYEIRRVRVDRDRRVLSIIDWYGEEVELPLEQVRTTYSAEREPGESPFMPVKRNPGTTDAKEVLGDLFEQVTGDQERHWPPEWMAIQIATVRPALRKTAIALAIEAGGDERDINNALSPTSIVREVNIPKARNLLGTAIADAFSYPGDLKNWAWVRRLVKSVSNDAFPHQRRGGGHPGRIVINDILQDPIGFSESTTDNAWFMIRDTLIDQIDNASIKQVRTYASAAFEDSADDVIELSTGDLQRTYDSVKNEMMTCADCGNELIWHETDDEQYWWCPNCNKRPVRERSSRKR
jgi:DNA-directed RNA polymerase subunit RPC12/RpoP